jgi:hypothetical protein
MCVGKLAEIGMEAGVELGYQEIRGATILKYSWQSEFFVWIRVLFSAWFNALTKALQIKRLKIVALKDRRNSLRCFT